MIDELIIQDLGVIASSRLQFGKGFTVITGETGAGKTMVVTALNLLAGARGDSTIVRDGSAQARIACSVYTENPAVTSIVDDLGGAFDDDELLLARTVTAEGRSRAVVGGARTPISSLQEVAGHLFCLHGQSDQLRLKSAQQQRETLDAYGGSELAQVLSEHARLFRELHACETEYAELLEQKHERAREAERIRAEIEQIARAEPLVGEDADVEERIERLERLDDLRFAVTSALNALAGEDANEQMDARSSLSIAQNALETARRSDNSLASITESLAEAALLLDDAARALAHYRDELEEDPTHHLAQAHERKSQLDSLKRLYGPALEDVLEYAERAQKRLYELDTDHERIDTLRRQIETLKAQFQSVQSSLSALRAQAATELSQRVTAELSHLALGEAVFTVELQPCEAGPFGAEQVCFLLQAHPQAPARPLGKTASGGELSRIMLALEVVLAEKTPAATFVFDEVDSGVSGSAAIEIGKRLSLLAKSSQVIVVTHLPQVAAFANNHLRVHKNADGGYTESSCTQLSHTERVQEIARLLSGLSNSESALTHAKELLDLAQEHQSNRTDPRNHS